MIGMVRYPRVCPNHILGHMRGDGHHSRIQNLRPAIDKQTLHMIDFHQPIRQIPRAAMTVLRPLSLICFLGIASATQAQDIPDALDAILTEQGYDITSTRYTWLGRIYIEASNGDHTRSILIARQTGRILQDDVIAGLSAPRPTDNAQDDREPDAPRQVDDAQPPPPPDRARPSEGPDDRPRPSDGKDKGPAP